MLLAPIAWADDDHGRGERGRERGDEDARRVTVLVQSPAQTTVVQRRDDDDENENENEDREERVVVAPNAAAGLIEAINNEVANLMNREVENEDEDEDENEVEDVNVGQVTVISLGALETGLSAADATAVTNAVNANAGALQTFLGGTNPLAVALRNALTAAGIAPSSVLAILQGREDRLVVVTG